MEDLFDSPSPPPDRRGAPLAERMRPSRLGDVLGQAEVLGPKSPLGRALATGSLPSLILWGPPGCGKTTLARCLADEVGATLLSYSAVRVGVKELKGVMADAARLRRTGSTAPVLFLDEIHRFNKAQQDALLPHVELGDVVLLGATTENPSFEVNAALLSRCRVIALAPLAKDAVVELLRRALSAEEGLGPTSLRANDAALRHLADRSGGDARFALGSLELAAQQAQATGQEEITQEIAASVVERVPLHHDRAGEEHYNLLSALQKSVRNSDAQASVYWLARMLEAGEEPLLAARRLVRMASEDVGMADPAALPLTVAASQAVHQLGMPEGALALVEATVYLAQAPKSNALETAYDTAVAAIREGSRDPVPLHLRNAPTRLMKEQGYGENYRYSHDHPDAVAEMECRPPSVQDRIFYRPTDRGFEREAAERLRAAWRRSHPRKSEEPE